MSQYYFNFYYYEPTSFGHPHWPSEPQVTEPFWNQYPAWISLDLFTDSHRLSPGNNYYKYAMDTPLVIGYNSRLFGRKAVDTNKNFTMRPNGVDKPRAKGKVDVYIDGHFLQQVPLSLLVRFSTAAQDAFPKPGKAGAIEEKNGTVGDWAEDNGQTVDIAKLTSDMAKLKKPSVDQPVDSIDGSLNKTLDLYSEQLYLQPPVEAFKFAFDWMEHAKRTSVGESVLPYGIPNPDKLSLPKLVDLYAAALCLRLRPPPAKIRADLFTRLTAHPPSIHDVVYIHEHLPIDDRVVTRLITSFLQKRGASQGVYTKAQRDEIENYFYEVDEALYSRYVEIEKHREEKRKSNWRDRGAAELQKLAEGYEGHGNVNGEKTVIVNGHASSNATNGTNHGEGRRGNHGKQQEMGKGVNGKSAST